MASRYQLEPLAADGAARWEELTASYPSFELFHRKPWLNYLTQSRGMQIRYWRLSEGSRTLGYFCGGILRKGPFRILGSPLKGWGTNFMGPVMNGNFDPAAFLGALDGLASTERLAVAELESRVLSDAALEAAHYEPVTGWTYWVKLTPDNPDMMWKGLESVCRNRVRKAMKAGLTVEDARDPAAADEFYDRYCELMRRKRRAPPYPRAYPRLLFRHLKEADLLFALRVRDNTGRVLAVGLFPHDHQTVYFWGGASWQDGRDLCPNEFLHWSAMRLAAERGLTRYDMCGYGRFKKKFGGELITLKRWHKCYWKSARWARRAYGFLFQKRQRLQGWWEGIRASHPPGDGQREDAAAAEPEN